MKGKKGTKPEYEKEKKKKCRLKDKKEK